MNIANSAVTLCMRDWHTLSFVSIILFGSWHFTNSRDEPPFPTFSALPRSLKPHSLHYNATTWNQAQHWHFQLIVICTHPSTRCLPLFLASHDPHHRCRLFVFLSTLGIVDISCYTSFLLGHFHAHSRTRMGAQPTYRPRESHDTVVVDIQAQCGIPWSFGMVATIMNIVLTSPTLSPLIIPLSPLLYATQQQT